MKLPGHLRDSIDCGNVKTKLSFGQDCYLFWLSKIQAVYFLIVEYASLKIFFSLFNGKVNK